MLGGLNLTIDVLAALLKARKATNVISLSACHNYEFNYAAPSIHLGNFNHSFLSPATSGHFDMLPIK